MRKLKATAGGGAFFPHFDHLSFRYAKRLYHPLVAVKNSVRPNSLRRRAVPIILLKV